MLRVMCLTSLDIQPSTTDMKAPDAWSVIDSDEMTNLGRSIGRPQIAVNAITQTVRYRTRGLVISRAGL